MISIRKARVADAIAIGAVHVAAWRSAYPGILPDAYLAGLSVTRQAAYYDNAIRSGVGVYVAAASGLDLPDAPARPDGRLKARVIGFVTAERARVQGIAEGEIETLYVLDDWRERGIGRRLMRAAGAHLRADGCRSAFLWVLRDNPSRWFYERLGGKSSAQAATRVAGRTLIQTAFVWDPIERLLEAPAQAS
jgi:ribosomal protein S18 acetylase RimI-like enzyme